MHTRFPHTIPQHDSNLLPCRCFLHTLRTEGVLRGLYAGALPSLVSNVGENAVLFAAYGRCQRVWSDVLGCPSVEEMGPLGNALSGSSAAVFSAMWLCPTEHIKCQLQVCQLFLVL